MPVLALALSFRRSEPRFRIGRSSVRKTTGVQLQALGIRMNSGGSDPRAMRDCKMSRLSPRLENRGMV